MRRLILVAACAASALAGCATNRVVDSDVQTFSTLAASPAEIRYRFERLPSQQAQGAQQAWVERIAEGALQRVGVRRDDAAARYTVQAGLTAQRHVSYDPWGGPFYGGAFGRWGWGPGWYGRGFGPWGGFGAFGPWPDQVIYAQQVGIVMRDVATGQVVYETHAAYDDVRPADEAAIAAMFDSALAGFPRPPAGVRRVTVTLPPPGAATPVPAMPAVPAAPASPAATSQPAPAAVPAPAAPR